MGSCSKGQGGQLLRVLLGLGRTTFSQALPEILGSAQAPQSLTKNDDSHIFQHRQRGSFTPIPWNSQTCSTSSRATWCFDKGLRPRAN